MSPRVSAKRGLDKASRRFQVAFRDVSKLPKEYIVPRIEIKNGTVIIDEKHEPRIHIDGQNSKFRWSRELGERLYEHGFLELFTHQLSGQGCVIFTEEYSPASLSGGASNDLIPFTVLNSLDSDFDTYNISVDLKPWPKGQEASSLSPKFQTFGKLSFTTRAQDETGGLSLPEIRLDVLDHLCEVINQKFPEADKIDSLYTSTVNLAIEEGDINTVVFTAAPLIAELADKIQGSIPRTSLTFQNSLKSDIVLPLLFQEMRISKKDAEVYGALYEYDSLMRGSLGERHYVTSHIETSFATNESTRSLDPSTTACGTEMPAPITINLLSKETIASQSIAELILLPGYNDITMHNKTQGLVNDAMLYHMDEDDRVGILNEDKPESLPKSLGEDLEDRLIDWLRTSYAPAYIANLLVHTDPDSRSHWRQKISDKQAMKVQYWFSGQGETCLAQEPKYNEITKIASYEAMLANFPKLRFYTDDPQSWADRLAKAFTEPSLQRSILQNPMSGGVNWSNKISALISFFDLEKKHTQASFYTTMAHLFADTLATPFLDNSPETSALAKEYFESYFDNLLMAVFGAGEANTLPISSDLQDTLLSDIQDVESRSNLDSSQPASTRIAALWRAYPTLINDMCSSLSPISDNTTVGGTDVNLTLTTDTEGLGSVKAAFKAGFSRAQDIWNRVYTKNFPDRSPQAAGLKGVFSICTFAFFVKTTVTCFSRWDESNPEERSNLATNSLYGAVSSVDKSLKAFKEFKNARVDRLEQLINAYKIDEEAEASMLRVADEIRDNLLDSTGSTLESRVSAQILESGLTDDASALGNIGDDALDEIYPYLTTLFEDVNTPTAGVKVVAKAFNTAETWLGGATVVLSIGLVITSSLSLADHWEKLDEPTRFLNIASIATTGLSNFANQFVADALVEVGWIAAEGTADAFMAVTLPIVGVVLAVIGALVSVLLVVFDKPQPPPPPPPTPVEIFIGEKLPALVEPWQSQPTNLLQYSQEWVQGYGSQMHYKISATNASRDNRVRLENVTFKFKYGGQSSSLMTGVPLKVTKQAPIEGSLDTGLVYLDAAESASYPLIVTLVSNKRDPGTTSYDAKITGIASGENEDGKVNIGPGGGFTLLISSSPRKGTPSELSIAERFFDPITDSSFHTIWVK